MGVASAAAAERITAKVAYEDCDPLRILSLDLATGSSPSEPDLDRLRVSERSRLVSHRFENQMKQCLRGHLLSADNIIRNTPKRYHCRECRRIHQWLVKRGLRITDYTVSELLVMVPPRERRAHFKTGRRAALVAQLVQLSQSVSSRAEER